MQFMIQHLPIIITICTALAGIVGWGIGKVRKNYGLERDIAHLQRDYQTLSNHSSTLLTELERRLDSVEREITILKTLNQSLMAQISGGDSGFFNRPQNSN